ncbi:uncharacterized protein LOC134231401 [Saccostrea cucullata]|uniref:uncharacterized protein LOC134231401 n=1 Tax=Saccostrea cuccullata TaxID=36930 RepID=UPI002ED04795
MSESVFVGLCHVVGTSQQVAIRRDMMDIEDILSNKASIDSFSRMTSGSHREGFRIKGSDRDIMFWTNNNRVIWDISQTRHYNRQKFTIILCDCSDSPPGYCLLQLLIPQTIITLSDTEEIIAIDTVTQSALFERNDSLFISSSLYRDAMRQLFAPSLTPHGPCAGGNLSGIEYDIAYCFACDFWPPVAASWIDRCHSWPKTHVLWEIIKSGCHFVATGHKLGNYEDHEWRISFSRAEQILVYSMNHTQFLTYGLLKLILKEVINKGLGEEDKLLCSYHMKTAVFWLIQQNTIPLWCPQNLLLCFWECFKLILKWVYEGVCPNFFVSQNNMFLSSIHGDKQNQLFIRLYTLYEKGLITLLHSPTIWPYVLKVLHNPGLSISTDEGNLLPEYKFYSTLFECTPWGGVLGKENLHHCIKCLRAVEQLINTPLTPYHVVSLLRHTNSILRDIAFILYNMYKTCRNKMFYIVDRMSHRLLKLTCKFGCISDMVYMAMYYYKTMRFVDALLVIETTIVIQSYKANKSYTPSRHTEVSRGRSLISKIRFFTSGNTYLNNKICYINELLPEQQSCIQERRAVLTIPVLILLHMLEILCYLHVDVSKVHTALCNLQQLVHHPENISIPKDQEDISWQILGICYQVTGNPQAALYAYQQSLSRKSCHKIENATLLRIQNILR